MTDFISGKSEAYLIMIFCYCMDVINIIFCYDNGNLSDTTSPLVNSPTAVLILPSTMSSMLKPMMS